MREIALHILDIAENSISAAADRIEIKINEDMSQDLLEINILDNGMGMDAKTVDNIADPFITSRTTRKVGLGIPFFKAAAEACDGSFKIESQPGIGTNVSASFKHSHIDRMPLGDITGTILTLFLGTPNIHWIYEQQVNDKIFFFDDQPIKETLDGISLTEPSILKYLRETLEEGIALLYDIDPISIESIT